MKVSGLYAAGPVTTAPVPAPDVPLALLGNLTPQQFMSRIWHKKPMLIRQAVPGIASPVTRDELFALAASDEVESRLITQPRGKWQLQHGPLAPAQLPGPRSKNWTLLVQGLNLHVPAAHELMSRFRFVPDARLDDLMISYAADGGGVGPHFDSYDVFLLQVQGRRRWRISTQKDLTLVPDMPLKILQNFEAEEEWVLEPGDMLYLPPHVAHDGVAEGECMTCSIGFRAPTWNELVANFLQYLAEGVAEDPRLAGRYADPRQPAVSAPALLPEAMVDALRGKIEKLRWDDTEIRGFLGAYLSEPKASVFFDAPDPALKEPAFSAQVRAGGVALHPKTLVLIDGADIHINGESFEMPRAVRRALTQLANARQLGAADAAALLGDDDMRESLHDWYLAGWLVAGAAPEAAARASVKR